MLAILASWRGNCRRPPPFPLPARPPLMKPIASSAPARQARRFPSLQRLATVTLVALAVAAASRSLPAQTGGAAGTATAPVIATQPFSAVVTHPQREAAASVIARNESKISAEVGGVILHWSAEAGSTVKKGERLLEIDPTDFRLAEQRAQAALDASAARLRQAEQQLERARVLVGKGFFSKEALIQRETEVALMRSEVAVEPRTAVDRCPAARQDPPARALYRPASNNAWRRPAKRSPPAMSSTSWLKSAPPKSAHTSRRPMSPACNDRARSFSPAQGQRHPLRLLRVGSTVSAPARTQEVRLAFATGSAIPSRRQRWPPALARPAAAPARRACWCGAAARSASLSSRAAMLPSSPCPAPRKAARWRSGCRPTTRVVVRGQATLQDGAAIP
jgi:pyruvate/2-oxoglutarate dehydrogenase complex dihydrolipoamide acyltransferase (E2) component